jgi:hypothetical protein
VYLEDYTLEALRQDRISTKKYMETAVKLYVDQQQDKRTLFPFEKLHPAELKEPEPEALRKLAGGHGSKSRKSQSHAGGEEE